MGLGGITPKTGERKYNLSEEDTKPYFKLENVLMVLCQ